VPEQLDELLTDIVEDTQGAYMRGWTHGQHPDIGVLALLTFAHRACPYALCVSMPARTLCSDGSDDDVASIGPPPVPLDPDSDAGRTGWDQQNNDGTEEEDEDNDGETNR